MLVHILIGLLLLSILVFVHEAGHFIAARTCGVDVLAFSIGFGPVLFKKKKGQTEYRISLLPLGGYCSLRGEDAFEKAIEENLPAIPSEPRTLYGVSKIRRIIIAFAGPLANYLFAIIGFTLVAAIGTTYYTNSNQIAPTYYYGIQLDSPAKQADLQMGDRIVAIDGKPTAHFDDIYQIIALNPEHELTFTVQRNGTSFDTKITPVLNKETGAGVIGFYPYIPLAVQEVVPDSPVEKAGILPGDIITGISTEQNAEIEPLQNTQDLSHYFINHSDLTSAVFTLKRDGETVTIVVDLPYYSETKMPNLGLITESIKVTVAGKSFFGSIAEGFMQTNKTVAEVFKSLGLLFKGINFKSALAGPLSISSMLGENATSGFAESFSQGVYNIALLASFICVSLFIMNLLPIPVLDGGIIFIALIEIIARRNIRPKVLYRIQIAGTAMILLLACFALWADINRLFLP